MSPRKSPGQFEMTPHEALAFSRVSKRQLFDATILLMARTAGVTKPEKLWAANGGGTVQGGGTRREAHIDKVIQLIHDLSRKPGS